MCRSRILSAACQSLSARVFRKLGATFESLERRRFLSADIPLNEYRYVGTLDVPRNGTVASSTQSLVSGRHYLLRARTDQYCAEPSPGPDHEYTTKSWPEPLCNPGHKQCKPTQGDESREKKRHNDAELLVERGHGR